MWIMHLSIVCPTTPVWGKVEITEVINHDLIWPWNSVPIMGNSTSIQLVSYTVDISIKKPEQLQSCMQSTKTHNTIYCKYSICIHENCSYYVIDRYSSGARWGFDVKSCLIVRSGEFDRNTWSNTLLFSPIPVWDSEAYNW